MSESDVRDSLRYLADQALPAELTAPALRRGRWMKVRRNVGAGIGALAVAAAFTGGYAGISHLRSTSPTASAAAPKPSATWTPPAAPAEVPVASCTIQTLSFPHGSFGSGTPAIDPTGHYMINGNTIWHDGVPRLLAHMSGSQLPRAVNSSGVVIGVTSDRRAFKDVNDHITVLAQLPGYDASSPYGINSEGDVVGVAFHKDGDGGAAVIWPAAHPGTVRKLDAPAGPHGWGPTAYDIDDNGVVVGTLSDGSEPYMWDASGHGHQLSVPAGYTGGKLLAVSGDWASGWVGAPNKTFTNLRPARWNLVTGAVTVYTDQIETSWDVAATGDVLIPGSRSDLTILVHNGQEQQLPATPGATLGTGEVGPVAQAWSISRDGSTIAGMITTTPVIWHC